MQCICLNQIAHSFIVLSHNTEFEEPTAKAPLWRPYAPSAGATFETIAIVEARGLDFLSIDFSVCIKSMLFAEKLV